MIEVVSPYYITNEVPHERGYKVYHIRSGIVNIILFFSKNIVAKSFMASTKLVSERLSEICVREKGLLFMKRMLVLIISTCSSVFHPSSVSHILWGRSSLMIFDQHANLKYKYGNRSFGVEGIMLIRLDETK